MAYMSRHPTGRDVAWTFYKKNFQRLVDMYVIEILKKTDKNTLFCFLVIHWKIAVWERF